MKNGTYTKQRPLSRLTRDAHRSGNEPGLSRRKQFSAACRAKVAALKERLTKQLAAHYANSLSATLIRQAVQEADALAATTLFPDLLLPVLAEEKVRSAHAWSTRQDQIRRETLAFPT